MNSFMSTDLYQLTSAALKILNWTTFTLLIGESIGNSSLAYIRWQEYEESDCKGESFSCFNNLYAVELLEKKRGTSFVTVHKKFQFVFNGTVNEFELLVSKVLQHPLSHSWLILLMTPESSDESEDYLIQWIAIVRKMSLAIDSEVFFGLWNSRGMKLYEIYRICQNCMDNHKLSSMGVLQQSKDNIIITQGKQCSLSKYERRKNLELTTLNVIGVDVVPFFVNVRQDDTGEFQLTGGLFATLFSILVKDFNATYRLKILNGYQYGAFKNGSWNGMIGFLSRGEDDMTISEVSMAPDRLSFIDFTTSFDTIVRKMYIRRIVQGKNINWHFYTAPFSLLVHFSVQLSVVTMMALLWLAEDNISKSINDAENFTLKETLWMAFSTICQKGSHLEPSNRSSRIIFVVFSFTFVIIFCAYSATLISQLAVSPPITKPFKDLQDFVSKSGNWKGGPIKGDLMQIYMEKTCPELLKTLGAGENLQCELLVRLWNKVIAGDKDTLPLSFQEGLTRVVREKFAFIATSTGTRYRIANDLSEVDGCKVLEMDGDYVTSNLAFGLRKQNQFKGLFDYKILRLRSSGVLKRLKQVWLPQKKVCSDVSVFNDATIYDVGVVAVIWTFGCCVSLLLLVGEIMLSAKRKVAGQFINLK